MQIEKTEKSEMARWTIVMDEGKEVFRTRGHAKTAHAKCARWIESQKHDIQHYRESARKFDETQAWVETVRGTNPPGTVPKWRSTRW